MTLTFLGISYQQIGLNDCLPLVQRFEAEGKRWHSHVLSSGSTHNPFGDNYALMVEDDTTTTAYIADAGAVFPEVDKALVKMLHGDDILDAGKAQGNGAMNSSRLLAHLRELQEIGVEWHHHMHFPNCVFNPHAGCWSIPIESPAILFAEAFPEEPIDVLREVEVLYFANLRRQE